MSSRNPPQSKLAEYSSSGKLRCKICQEIVSGSWIRHERSSGHKDTFTRLKQLAQQRKASAVNSTKKSPEPSEQKSESKSTAKRKQISSYSAAPSKQGKRPKSVPSNVPADFFESGSKSTSSSKPITKQKKSEIITGISKRKQKKRKRRAQIKHKEGQHLKSQNTSDQAAAKRPKSKPDQPSESAMNGVVPDGFFDRPSAVPANVPQRDFSEDLAAFDKDITVVTASQRVEIKEFRKKVEKSLKTEEKRAQRSRFDSIKRLQKQLTNMRREQHVPKSEKIEISSAKPEPIPVKQERQSLGNSVEFSSLKTENNESILKDEIGVKEEELDEEDEMDFLLDFDWRQKGV